MKNVRLILVLAVALCGSTANVSAHGCGWGFHCGIPFVSFGFGFGLGASCGWPAYGWGCGYPAYAYTQPADAYTYTAPAACYAQPATVAMPAAPDPAPIAPPSGPKHARSRSRGAGTEAVIATLKASQPILAREGASRRTTCCNDREQGPVSRGRAGLYRFCAVITAQR